MLSWQLKHGVLFPDFGTRSIWIKSLEMSFIQLFWGSFSNIPLRYSENEVLIKHCAFCKLLHSTEHLSTYYIWIIYQYIMYLILTVNLWTMYGLMPIFKDWMRYRRLITIPKFTVVVRDRSMIHIPVVWLLSPGLTHFSLLLLQQRYSCNIAICSY